MNELFDTYYELRDELDTEIRRIESLHSHHITCSKMCSHCCMNFGVLSIEAYAIAKEIDDTKFSYKENVKRENCVFLQDSLCMMYASRPFICRTQGLPLIYEINDAYELSVCERNFINCNDTYFAENNCLFMDLYNSKLYLLHTQFVEQNPELQLQINQLIPLNSIPYLCK